MKTCMAAAFTHARTVMLGLALLLVSGAVAYLNIPKESAPDVAIPLINVSMNHEGISPEDAERLLLRPMAQALRSIAGLKEMRATAREGSAAITLEFDAGFDSDQALQDVRDKVDPGKVELPPETDEPAVNEVNVALFPVLTVILSGQVPERTLVRLARELEDKIEAIPGVLAVDIAGDREEVIEVTVDPLLLDSYNLSLADLFQFVQNNNRLVAAGMLDTGASRFVIKVPGVIEDAADVFNLPIKVDGNTVVTFKDIATIRHTFTDPTGFARVRGRPAVALEVSKRIGANMIDTIAQVRASVEAERQHWSASVAVNYMQDRSKHIRTMLGDLQNNVLGAIFLVMMVSVAALGMRSALLVGIAIPGSCLAGILVIFALGLTLNIVVLFSLILVVGMLVDGAIVVVELADRQITQGLSRRAAYQLAATRMAWPIIASTATTLAVFLPLLFWPGVVGAFMKYLPITVLATLTVSLLMALIFVPVLGGLLDPADITTAPDSQRLAVVEGDTPDAFRGLTGAYMRVLQLFLRHPAKVLLAAFLFLLGAYAAYGAFGHGVEFFPDIEPENAQIQVRSRDDLSVWEQDALLRQVESCILDMPEFSTVYARSGRGSQHHRHQLGDDVIGVIQLEFIDWRQRRPAAEILADVHQRTANLAGIVIETREQRSGPSAGKPIQLEVRARDSKLLAPAVAQLWTGLRQISGLVHVEDNRPLPGIEWRLQVDRAEAARYGANVTLLGNTVQMVTNGIKVGDYRPNDTDQEVDIRLRFPSTARTLDQLERLRVPTSHALVPISNFVTFVPAPKVGIIRHTDSHRVMTVQADVATGVLVADKVRDIRQWLAHANLDSRVRVQFKGQDADRREARRFLATAFVGALCLMAILLVTLFNSFYQAALILSAVVFSTAGVLLGLLVTAHPFGIVMGGIGVIALAGIVVNNNIVLIDTYNDLRVRGLPPHEAILHTGAQRLRPVLLTTITTILGLLPMMFGVNIDFLSREMTVGAPATQWWTQLASTIVGGLTFATLLTLLLTPCLLILGANLAKWRAHRRDQTDVAVVATSPDMPPPGHRDLLPQPDPSPFPRPSPQDLSEARPASILQPRSKPRGTVARLDSEHTGGAAALPGAKNMRLRWRQNGAER